jgi:carboxymethylenebutenolidase
MRTNGGLIRYSLGKTKPIECRGTNLLQFTFGRGHFMQNIETEKVSLEIADGTQMNAFVARPSDSLNHPGLLILQEAYGVNPHIRDVTERFAREGYVSIAPELYHRTAPGFEGKYDDIQSAMPHMKAITEKGMIEDLRAAYDWLTNSSYVASEKIASIGFCMGGRASFLACATLPLQASISFYGGNIAPALLPRVADLRAPILFFWGGLDKHIGVEQIRAVVDECKRAGKMYVNVEISNADHGFFCDARPSYNPEAATLSWNFVATYLRLHLGTTDEQTRLR